MTDCIFCKIIKGEVPCTKVYEDTSTLAFLDIAPINPGHTLVIPKQHYETIMDIPENLLENVTKTVKKISIALSKMSDGISIAQNNKKSANQLVPHLHFHIMPRYKDDGHKFTWPKEEYKKGEAEKLAEKIKSLL